MSKNRAYKRKIYLINRDFQVKFLLYSIGLSLITITIFYFMIHSFFEDTMLIGIQSGFPKDHIYFQFIENNKADMNLYFLFASIAVFAFILLSGILYSHKIAGPIYRTSAYLRTLAIDKLKLPLNFRKNDFFHELSESYNKRLGLLRDLATNDPEKLIEALKYEKGEKK